MSRVSHYGHGVYCYRCQEVYDGTEGCDHDLGDKAGVQKKHSGGYIAQPADMGHYSPHMWIEVDGAEQCGECGAVKIPREMVDD